MDAFVFEQINQFAFNSFWLDSLGVFFAEIIPFALAIFLLLLLLVDFKKHKEMVVLSFLAAGLSRVFAAIIRTIFPHPRPFTEMTVFRPESLIEGEIKVLLKEVNASSFPSAHTAFFFAISSVLYFYNKKLSFIFFILSFLMAGSRIFCGVHWPLDILGGIGIGLLSGILVIGLFKKLKKNKKAPK